MGWLEGALRLMPNWETRIAGFTIPNPFYAGVVPPGILFGLLYAWPWIEARVTKDHREHHVLDRPRDRPVRTALGVAVLIFCSVLGFAGSDDVLAVAFNLSVNSLVWTMRILLVVGPLVAFGITYKVCKELQKRDGPFVDPDLDDEAASSDRPPDGGSGHDGGDDDEGGPTGTAPADPDRVPVTD
jgi:ubiquinol-cytochrome c reductase cytochrome b subunit